jgi:hypothetical protein
MNRASLQCEVEKLSPQEAHIRIALVALAITSVGIAVTASALNAIAISQSETEARRNNLTNGSAESFRGSAPSYGIVHVTMPKGKKAFPPELVPVP